MRQLVNGIDDSRGCSWTSQIVNITDRLINKYIFDGLCNES